jgi:hypothetical protein
MVLAELREAGREPRALSGGVGGAAGVPQHGDRPGARPAAVSSSNSSTTGMYQGSACSAAAPRALRQGADTAPAPAPSGGVMRDGPRTLDVALAEERVD